MGPPLRSPGLLSRHDNISTTDPRANGGLSFQRTVSVAAGFRKFSLSIHLRFVLLSPCHQFSGSTRVSGHPWNTTARLTARGSSLSPSEYATTAGAVVVGEDRGALSAIGRERWRGLWNAGLEPGGPVRPRLVAQVLEDLAPESIFALTPAFGSVARCRSQPRSRSPNTARCQRTRATWRVPCSKRRTGRLRRRRQRQRRPPPKNARFAPPTYRRESAPSSILYNCPFIRVDFRGRGHLINTKPWSVWGVAACRRRHDERRHQRGERRRCRRH